MVSRNRSAGVARREFSLASKVLHWLLPYRVPAYNSYVRQTLRICGAANHSEQAYRKVAHEILGATRTITDDGSWLGVLETDRQKFRPQIDQICEAGGPAAHWRPGVQIGGYFAAANGLGAAHAATFG